MHFVVVGCGPMGVELALALEQAGHSVAVVDESAAALARLGPAFAGARVVGCGFERDVLVKAGIENAGGFAAMTGDDKTNALAAHVARSAFKVARVVARLVDGRQVETYEHLEVATVAPNTWGALRAQQLLAAIPLSALLSFGNGEVEIVQLVPPSETAGQELSGLAVPGEITPVAIVRDGHAFVPTAGTRLRAGDIVYLSVVASARGRLQAMLK